MKAKQMPLNWIAAIVAASHSLLLAQTTTPARNADTAPNPIVQTKFTADPAPLVHDGVVYLYAGHDEDDARGFKMLDWQCYSSTDMVNWTDRGAVECVHQGAGSRFRQKRKVFYGFSRLGRQGR